MTTKFRSIHAAVALAIAAGGATAQPLSISLVDVRALPTTAEDQNATAFDVTGASGVTYLGNDRFAFVLDNSNHVLFLDLTFNPDGSVATSVTAGGLSLDTTADHEGIAPNGPGSVLISNEEEPGVRSYALTTGVNTGAITIPAVFADRRSNRGFESLTSDGTTAYTANEEALTVDGDASSPSNGSTVRMLQFDPVAGTPGPQYAYETESMHGPFIPLENPGQSGLTDLVLLPDGRLLAAERSLALATPLFFSRIFEVSTDGATDVSALPALAGETFTPVSKNQLWSGDVGNLEGLALGPVLPDGSSVLIGAIDDGDPFSTNTFIVLKLTSGTTACNPADLDANGVLNFDDIDAFVAGFLGGDLIADLDGNGALNFDDIDLFVASFLAGCP